MDIAAPIPSGPARRVVFLDSASVGGAPVAYVVVFAAVIAAFSFVPFSVVLSGGSSFPMSQGIYPMTGWILGPWAGAVACGVGALVGIFLAPHTAGIPWLTIGQAAGAGVFAGAIVRRGRWALWTGAAALIALEAAGFAHHAVVVNGVPRQVFINAYWTHWFGMLLFLPPFRGWIARGIQSPDLRRVSTGLFFGTWSAASLMMFSATTISYYILNWPTPLFVFFAAIVPVEQAIRSAIGAVIGTGVIAGLRAMALVRARNATF